MRLGATNKFQLSGRIMSALLNYVSIVQIFNPRRASSGDHECDFHNKFKAVEGRTTANGDVFYYCDHCRNRLNGGRQNDEERKDATRHDRKVVKPNFAGKAARRHQLAA